MFTENVFNQSLWGDEGFSAILSMKTLPDIIKIISRDTSPPLWNIFEYFTFNTLGTAEIYIRGLAFVFFLGAVFFTYKIGSLFWSKKTGVLAALLTFLNPFFFTYGFEGRMYSIMAFGVAGSMYFFAKSFFGEGGKWTRIGYIVFTLWALYSHHFAIFALFIQGIWWLYELAFGRRQTAKRIFKSWILIGLGYLPWLYPLYNQTKMVGGGFWLGTPTIKDLLNLIFDYLARGIKSTLELPYVQIKLIDFALYVVLAAMLFRKSWKSISKSIFLLLWFLGPIVLTWLVSQKFQSIFFNRYLLYTIPGAMLVLASNRMKFSFIPITLIIVSFLIIDFNYFTHPSKLPFREMSGYVKQTQKPGDFLINWYSNGTHHIWETKYYDIPAPIFVSGSGGDLPYFVGTALMEENDLIKSIPENTKRVGVVTSGPVEEVKLPGYTEFEAKDFKGLKFIWLSKARNP